MFRKMRRFKQEIPQEECLKILREEKRGVLSLIGDDGYPYGIPMNQFYYEKTGKIYFHGAKEGHKIDAIKNCAKASFCVYDKGFVKEGEWALNIKSVVVFGKIRLVESLDEAKEICLALCRKFNDDPAYIEKEMTNALGRVQCLEMTIERMTGKLVNES